MLHPAREYLGSLIGNVKYVGFAYKFSIGAKPALDNALQDISKFSVEIVYTFDALGKADSERSALFGD
jgi:hypothetical protein